MADASRSPHSSGSNPPGSTPPGWGDVFAALPLETPPASAWPTIAAQLDRKKTPVRSRTWLALAASLFALTALPVTWMLLDTDRSSTLAEASPDATSPDMPPRARAVDTPATTAGPEDPRIATAGDTHSAQALSITMDTAHPAPATRARRSTDRSAHRRTAPTPSIASVAQPRDNADTTLETLYTASAQLETLLTFARDTRVESGPAAALASAFDAELATIDAQLAQPGLAADRQRMLWQARVDTLQRSAGFESNLRVLAADGGRLEGALVSVD